MTTKNDQNPPPPEREMTAGETAANKEHIAAHQKAVAEERERNEILRKRIEEGTVDPASRPDQLEVTPQAAPARSADAFHTQAEQHGGAHSSSTPAAAPAATPPPAADANQKRKS